MTTTSNPHDTGRELDWDTLKRQIGFMTVAAISGGRAVRVGPSTIDLPVASGYRVQITLEANDTYTVLRLFKRGGKMFVHGAVEGVYCDQVGEVAYRASCFRDGAFNAEALGLPA